MSDLQHWLERIERLHPSEIELGLERLRRVAGDLGVRTVPMPVITAELRARSLCTSSRASGPVIHWDSPLAMAVRPSTLAATLILTQGRSPRIRRMKPGLSARASLSCRPTSTWMPAARNVLKPLPAT